MDVGEFRALSGDLRKRPVYWVLIAAPCHWRSGTQDADWAGIPSTGKSFSTRMGVLYEFEEDQLVCERVYMDFGEISRQLGATVG